MASSDAPTGTAGVADTMPATKSEDGEPARDRRPTIPDLAPPTEERYRLGAELGRGGMGRVVEAFDVQLGRTVAFKEVLSKGGPHVERRFQREVQITARLEHPSIVPLYDAGRTNDGRAFYVMRRVTGRPLDVLLARAKELPERMALLPNLLAAFDAIGHAHRRGIIHRDLKPANILVGENGETVVIDWGLAKVIGEADEDSLDGAPTPADSLQTQAGAVFGTPGFMPPEQARGEGSTAHGDVFALGATLYQLLAGRPPIGGGGPTDVIASTIQRRIVPIAAAAPSAPAELHAIVEKALAFEPGDRYADAERLAEDLRRFSTGQLVAAHRYTQRERVARFARRHRAPLSVAALALATLAVLAWIGVHRIVVERDIAKDASTKFEQQTDKLAIANLQLREHADELLISRARAQLEINPTATLAILKDLAADSPRINDARGLAASAVARGVPWALRSEGAPRVLELDRAARHLAEVTMHGAVRVWDLDTRRLVYERPFEGTALWLADGRLLLEPDGDTPAMVLDLKLRSEQPLGIGPASQARLDDAGARLAFIGGHDVAKIVDVATGKVTAYWPGHAVRWLEISPDGAWLALTDNAHGVVIDVATGAIVLEHSGELLLLAMTNGSFAALLPSGTPTELVHDAGGWSERPIAFPYGRSFGMSYRAERLEVNVGDGIVVFVHGKYYGRRNIMPSMLSTQVVDETKVVQTANGSLAFYNDNISGTILLPAALDITRIAGRRDHTRFAVAGNGLVLIYDVAEILPRFVPKDGMFAAAFADRDTMLMWPGLNVDFSWLNLATNRSIGVDPTLLPITSILDSDPRDGRVLLFEQTGNKTAALVVARAGQRAIEGIAHGDNTLIGMLAPDGVLFGGSSTSRVLYSEHGAMPPRELAKVEGGVAYLRVLDRRRFAALGHSGELVRGELAGGALERVRIASADTSVLSSNRVGDVVITSGGRLDLWPTGGALRPIAVLPRRIARVEPSGAGLVVGLEDNSVYYVEPTGKSHEVVAATTYPASIGGDGTWLAVIGPNRELDIVELPSFARWSLPKLFESSGALEVSPIGRRVAATSVLGYVIFDLLDPGSDLAAWIDDHTNALESPDGALGWR